MKPLYDGQENHYKRMLELQEKLRKSEEERIRLEEKFNLMVQESRNRHQACINKLRIRYVEFLEDQRARDERNNKLLGTLDKVDSSIALMTAKTERLNILRKQYEAYLLRVYGTQQPNGSVTADSGLESQNDREISPSPVAIISKNAFPYSRQEFFPVNLKTPDPHNQYAHAPSTLQKPSDIQRDLSFKFSQAAAVPSLYDGAKDILKSRLYVPSYLHESPKYTSTPKVEAPRIEVGLRNWSTRPPAASTPGKYDLDRYLSKIKQLQADEPEAELPERSLEEADQEQNTSGDLLNVTLSDDGEHPSPEIEAAKERSSGSRFRELLLRQAYATENATRNRPIDCVDRTRGVPVGSEARGSIRRRGDALDGDGGLARGPFSAPKIDKFRQSEIAPARPDVKPFAQQRPPQLSVDDAFAKLAILAEPRRPNLQKQSLPVVDDEDDDDDDEEDEEEAAARKERETREPVEIDDSSDRESKKDGEGEGNGDGCIEDDYDDTVDIDSWMPDDAEQQVEEVDLPDDLRDLPRRKLESIEEVEHLEDDEDPVEDAKPDEQIAADDGVAAEQVAEQEIDEAEGSGSSKELVQESKEEQAKDSNETYGTNEEYVDQPYYQQDDNAQKPYQENAEYAQKYDQLPGDEQQHYQYSGDPNQQYGYDANAQYAGYDGQHYTEEQYQEYMNQQYQYDPNQAYEHDPNQEYQQYSSNQEYEGYQEGQQQQQGLPNEESNQNPYDPNQAYDYSQDPQAYAEGYPPDANQTYDYSAEQQAYAEPYASQTSEAHGSENSPSEHSEVQPTKNDDSEPKSDQPVDVKPKESKVGASGATKESKVGASATTKESKVVASAATKESKVVASAVTKESKVVASAATKESKVSASTPTKSGKVGSSVATKESKVSASTPTKAGKVGASAAMKESKVGASAATKESKAGASAAAKDNKAGASAAAKDNSKTKPKDTKKKKDVIKSILDSDSESFIEKNLSNTESDFDFN